MRRLGKWLLSTLTMAGLLFGAPLVLGSVTAAMLHEKLDFDTTWLLGVLPLGGLLGLFVGWRYQSRVWLTLLAGSLWILSAYYFLQWSTPIETPASMPRGMNRLPITVGNLLRESLLEAAWLTAGGCLVVAAVLNFIREFSSRTRATPT